MAVITSNGTNGLWSAGTTWVNGVAPADLDSVVISNGDTVLFDADTSGYANGISGLTINSAPTRYPSFGKSNILLPDSATHTLTDKVTIDCIIEPTFLYNKL